MDSFHVDLWIEMYLASLLFRDDGKNCLGFSYGFSWGLGLRQDGVIAERDIKGVGKRSHIPSVEILLPWTSGVSHKKRIGWMEIFFVVCVVHLICIVGE
ncbi:hypothetical protein CDAR_528741 [Caerostris darwini]|uniref:Uncharacterized protein n=1 Tax=Caerostris darwini TaxID=1538125 RepID=A0AAV4UNH2_9ARAC|nr:hypothetical protein CDAR_548251 [Caerostris darwini]GIY59497.1 hypothetical protein CDAR_528741 [Caerostris darwini]